MLLSNRYTIKFKPSLNGWDFPFCPMSNIQEVLRDHVYLINRLVCIFLFYNTLCS